MNFVKLKISQVIILTVFVFITVFINSNLLIPSLIVTCIYLVIISIFLGPVIQNSIQTKSIKDLKIKDFLYPFITFSSFRLILFLINVWAFYQTTGFENQSLQIILSIIIGWMEMVILFGSFDLFRKE